MPQTTQIVPKFSFPYVETVINDNTLVDNTVDTNNVDPTVKYIFAFMSGKGEDNVFIRKRSVDSFTSTYGDSNYKKYGQPLMMPINVLGRNNTSVWCMRVMPENASYANTLLALAYRADAEDAYPDEPSKRKFRIKVLQQPQEDITTSDQLSEAFANFTIEDEEEYNVIPFMRIRSMGRGKYGNNYTVKLSQNINYEKEFGIKMYNFDILSIEGGLTKIANYVGAFASSTKYQTATLINDILEDTERGIVPVDTYVNEENVEDIYDAYIEFCNEQHVLLEAEYQRKLEEYAIPEGMLEGTVEVTEEYAEMVEEMLKIEEMIDATEQEELPDLDEFDPVFGLKVASTSMLPFISFTQPISEADMESPDYDANDYTSTDESLLAELGSTKGVELGNGDEGDFDPKVDAETRQAAIEAAYTKAYDGTYDRRILTARRIPANAFWDANYPYSVKQTIVNLTLLRKDCIFYMDCGMDYTTFSAENIHRLLNDYSFVDHCLVSKNLQYYTVRESTTSKRVKVTTTYYLAAQYAQHIGNYGPHIPFVKASAELSGHIRDSLTPSIEDYETELKETLYTNRFNYFETLDENVFQRATQSTSQMAETDLIEENNVTVLYDIKRDIERDVQERLYNFADASSRSSFAAYEKAKYSAWVGSRILSIDIQFTANQWESEHSILHCYLAVVFRGLQKRAIVEIDINKRNYETGDATSLENE